MAGDQACQGHHRQPTRPRGAVPMMAARVPRMHGWSHPWKPLPVFLITFVHSGRLRKDLFPVVKKSNICARTLLSFHAALEPWEARGKYLCFSGKPEGFSRHV